MQRRSLEDRYDLKDERPRNHGGRYIPTDEEIKQWDKDRRHRPDPSFDDLTDAAEEEDYQDTIRSLLVGLR